MLDNHPLYLNLKNKGNFSLEGFPLFLSLWQEVSVKKNEHILIAGEVAKFIMFVIKGCLRQYSINENGNEKTVYLGEENWFLGDLFSLRSQTPSQLNIQALENCTLLTITKENWEKAFNEFPEFAKIHLENQHKKINNLQNQFSNSHLETPELRYLKLLKDRPTLLQRIPQYYIASFLGISPEALSRIRKRI